VRHRRGLLGVLVALRPDGSGFFSLAGLAVLGSAACYAISAVTGRILAARMPAKA
jgi:drug/metabolite transporter (DMT)-like permease